MTEHDTDVRGWLESVEAPPPRLDVDELVQIGRTQVRRRRQLVAGSAAGVALAVAAAAPVAIRVWPTEDSYLAADQYPVLDCTITELALPSEHARREGISVSPIDIDSTGRYIVGNPMGSVIARAETSDGTSTSIETYSAEGLEPVLWDDGVPTAIPIVDEMTSASAVNSSGVVVGTATDGENDWHGWVYRDGEISELPAPDGYRIFSVWDINNAGDVVGQVAGEDAPDNSESRLVVWLADSPNQPRFLLEPVGKDADGGGAIMEDKTVVGNVYDELPDGEDYSGAITGNRAYVWEPDGIGRYLQNPSGASEATVSAARGGWAAGFAKVRVPAAGVWSSAEPTDGQGPPSQSPGVPPSDLPVAEPTGDLAEIYLPVRWDLVTGEVEVLDPYEWGDRSNAYGEDVTPTGDVVLGSGLPLIYRDGDWFTVPEPADGFANLYAADDSGTVIVGEFSEAQIPYELPHNQAIVWRC